MKTKSKTRCAGNTRTKKTDDRKTVSKKPSSPLKSIGKIVKNNPKASTTTKKISPSKKESSDKTAKEWQVTFDAVSDPICLLDKKQRILRTNRAMQEMFGLSQNELLGKFCWEIVHCTTKPVRGCPATKLAKSLKPEKKELRVKDKIFNVRAFPVLDDKNTLSAIVHIISDITESKNTEENIKNYLNQLRSISEKLADGMVYQINSGRDGSQRVFTYLSPAVERLHGFKVVEAIHHSELIYGQILKEDLDSLIEAETRAFKNMTKMDQEVRIKMPSGEIRWRHFLSVPRQLSNGDIVWDGIEMDVTERKQMEGKIDEERKQLNYILDVTKTRIDIIDSDFNLRYVDDPWQKIYGNPTDRKCYEYFMGRTSPCTNCGIPKALNTKQIVITEEVLNREGNRVIEVHTIPFQNKEGEWLVAEFNIDITERKKSEDKLIESENKYHSIFDNSMDAILLTIPDGAILSANAAACKMFGRTEEDMLQLGRSGLVDFNDPRLPALLEERKRTGRCRGELTFIRKDGSKFEGEISSLTFKDRKDTPMASMIIRDISERKQAEETLKQRELLFKKLSAHVPGMIYQFVRKPDGTQYLPFSTDAIKTIFGCSPEDVARDYSPIIKVIFPEDLYDFVASIEYSAQHMTDWKHEYRVQLPGGSIRWMLGRSTPEKLPDGTIVWHGFNADITDQKNVQEHLKITQDNYRRLFEDHSAVKLIIDPEAGTILDANYAAADFYGWTRDEMKQMKISQINTLADAEVKCAMENALLEHKVHFEFRHRLADGSLRDVEVHSSRIEMDDKFVLHSIVHDITDRKRAEDEVKAWMKRYDMIVAASGQVAYEYILSTGRIIWGSSIANVLGYDMDEIGDEFQHWEELLHAEDKDRTIQSLETAEKVCGFFETQYRMKHKKGHYVWIRDRGFFVPDTEGKACYQLGMMEDITEQKMFENALQKSETKFRTLFESATDGIAVLEKDTFIDCNQQMLDIFGYSRENFIGQTPYNVSPEIQPDGSSSREKALDMINTALAGNPQHFEWMHTRSDGTPIYMEVSLNSIKEMGDFYIQVICRDISERKRAERELLNYRDHLEDLVKERTKELEAFSYSVSHDLRAPLRSIEGFSQAIWEDFQDKLDDRGKDYLKRVRKASLLMTELIDDMLKLSRITRTDIDILEVDLSDMANSVVNNLRKSHPERKVNVIITDHLKDYADPRLMRIVFENLLGNAWKFTSGAKNAEIEFGETTSGGAKTYFVRDNGAGFDMEYGDKLFAPFQRLHNIDEFPGTGVGLAIVRRIINRHGGKIWAQGQIDQGATFYFTLKG